MYQVLEIFLNDIFLLKNFKNVLFNYGCDYNIYIFFIIYIFFYLSISYFFNKFIIDVYKINMLVLFFFINFNESLYLSNNSLFCRYTFIGVLNLDFYNKCCMIFFMIILVVLFLMCLSLLFITQGMYFVVSGVSDLKNWRNNYYYWYMNNYEYLAVTFWIYVFYLRFYISSKLLNFMQREEELLHIGMRLLPFFFLVFLLTFSLNVLFLVDSTSFAENYVCVDSGDFWEYKKKSNDFHVKQSYLNFLYIHLSDISTFSHNYDSVDISKFQFLLEGDNIGKMNDSSYKGSYQRVGKHCLEMLAENGAVEQRKKNKRKVNDNAEEEDFSGLSGVSSIGSDSSNGGTAGDSATFLQRFFSADYFLDYELHYVMLIGGMLIVGVVGSYLIDQFDQAYGWHPLVIRGGSRAVPQPPVIPDDLGPLAGSGCGSVE